MSERDELALELFIADNSRQARARSIVDFERLGGETYAHRLADAALAAGYRKPLTIENDRLVIDDHGNLLLEMEHCTCASQHLGPEYGSCHEMGCGYEFLDDLTGALERSGYRKQEP